MGSVTALTTELLFQLLSQTLNTSCFYFLSFEILPGAVGCSITVGLNLLNAPTFHYSPSCCGDHNHRIIPLLLPKYNSANVINGNINISVFRWSLES